MLNILVIDDDRDIRFGLNRTVRRCGYDVVEASSGEEGLELMASQKIDMVFCDLRFPRGLSGEQILEAIQQQYPDVKVVMMSCAMDYTTKTELQTLGASDSLQKPFFKEQCLATIHALFPPIQKAA